MKPKFIKFIDKDGRRTNVAIDCIKAFTPLKERDKCSIMIVTNMKNKDSKTGLLMFTFEIKNESTLNKIEKNLDLIFDTKTVNK